MRFVTIPEFPRYEVSVSRNPVVVKSKTRMVQCPGSQRQRKLRGVVLTRGADRRYSLKHRGHVRRYTAEQLWASVFDGELLLAPGALS